MSNPKLCECGCGKEVKWSRHNKRWNRFINGHQARGKLNPNYGVRRNGKDNPMFGKKRPDVSKRMTENNPMKRIEIRAKVTGKNSPMKRPEVVAKVTGENHYMYGKSELNPMFGKHHTDETKIKISISQMKPRTDGYCDIWSDKEYRGDLLKKTCDLCGISKRLKVDINGRLYSNLQLHHKDLNKKNCHPDNIATLCINCHMSLHNAWRRHEAYKGWEMPLAEEQERK